MINANSNASDPIVRRAEAGEASAQYELGCRFYDRGDYAVALEWYRKAAAQGHNSGLCDTGYCYRNGYGVAQDYAAALPFYRQAAGQGCPTGAFWLAHAYEHGEGVETDLDEARRWYGIARDRGDADAAEALARLGSA